MRTAIYIDNRRILLAGIEIGRLDKAVVEVGLAVGSFDCACFYHGHNEVFIRVLCSQQAHVFPVLCSNYIYLAGNVGSGITVDDVTARSGEYSFMDPLAIIQRGAFACIHIYLI